MRQLTIFIALSFTAMSLVAALPPAQAQDAVSLTIEARESGCADDRTWCFEVTEGDLLSIQPGAAVTITFINAGQGNHQLDVVALEDADADNEATSPDGSLASTEPNMAPEAEETITFTAPTDGAGIYLFCGVTGHESLGMWLEVNWAAMSGPAEDDTGSAPAPGFVLLLAGIGIAGIMLRRRS